jgi:hypothetical protein
MSRQELQCRHASTRFAASVSSAPLDRRERARARPEGAGRPSRLFDSAMPFAGDAAFINFRRWATEWLSARSDDPIGAMAMGGPVA